VQSVARGIIAAGGLPMEFPTISLGESFLNPTAMVYRNLMAMDVEELVRAQPMDAVVLVGGCDKTVPAQMMGAFSAGRPAIQLVTAPMSTGRYQGERLGACADCRRFWARFRVGEVDAAEIARVERNLATTAGTCAVRGTASTMACLVEAIGMALPDSGRACRSRRPAANRRSHRYGGRRDRGGPSDTGPGGHGGLCAQRVAGIAGDRWLHQCAGAPDGHGRATRPRDRSG
jgi:dihydroxyacid dehydratase/phosphogluconate dehydratase